MSVTIHIGDCRDVLARLPDESVHCVVTSPPYWGLRDYGVEGQLGLEPTPEEYLETMVGIFADVTKERDEAERLIVTVCNHSHADVGIQFIAINYLHRRGLDDHGKPKEADGDRREA